jgi:hypothetical protein
MKKILSMVMAMVLCSITLLSVQAKEESTKINSGEVVYCNSNGDKNISKNYTITSTDDCDMKIFVECNDTANSYIYVRVTDNSGQEIKPYFYDGSGDRSYMKGNYFYYIERGDYTIELDTDAWGTLESLQTTVWLSKSTNTTINSEKTTYDTISWDSPKSYTITSASEGDMTVEFSKDGSYMFFEVKDSNGKIVAPYDYSYSCKRDSSGLYYLYSNFKEGKATYHIKSGQYTIMFRHTGNSCNLTTTVTVPSEPNITSSDISVILKGKVISFDQPPIIIDGRTLVPLRAIFEALGATVDWNGKTQTVTSTRENISVSLTINSKIMTKNGKEITLDVPAQLISDRTLVPVRAIAEAFNCNVNWNGDTQTVTITE